MGGNQVLDRAQLLGRGAQLLAIPTLATAHVPEKLGGVSASILEFDPAPTAKSSFSCAGDAAFASRLRELGRDQMILAGFEAHICIALTARELADQGLEVFVVADAVASRTSDRMEVALASLRAGGIRVEHSETILYGLLGAADHPAFREVLGLVKGSRY